MHNDNRVLLVHMVNFFGGGETHSLKKYKTLVQNGYHAEILVPKNSDIAKVLEQESQPHNTTIALKFFKTIKPLFKLILAWRIFRICKKQQIQIVNCNAEHELGAAKLAAKFANFKIVLTRHLPNPVKVSRIKGIDGIVGVNPGITEKLQAQSTAQNLGVKQFEFIAPFFDDEKLLKFAAPTESREDFFKNEFKINLNDWPLICMVANMYEESDRKNHTFLLKAIHKLVYEKNRTVQVVLAGYGPFKQKCMELTQNLGLQKYVHFLGFTNKTHQIYFYTDINVLTSYEEAFGLTLVEAALLKKPSIGTRDTGMECTIKHKLTGLLFDNNNMADFLSQLEQLIDNKDLRKTLGQNAFNFATENFLTEAKFKKLNEFYGKILCNSNLTKQGY